MQEIAKQGLVSIDKEQEFSFDACFGQHDTQDIIFEDVKMLIQSALNGFNVCIFAYG